MVSKQDYQGDEKDCRANIRFRGHFPGGGIAGNV
jgi:hypothetical protein